MKLNEITYDIREAIKEFSDDTELDDRYIIYLYRVKRSKYLRQALNNYNQIIDNSVKQTLCIGVEEISSNVCGVSYSCDTLLRSKKPLPPFMELHTKSAITNVTPSDKLASPFNFISREKARFIEGSAYSNSIYAFLDVDNYLYLYSANNEYKLLECITVTGVFENPQDLTEFLTCCDCDTTAEACFDAATSEYPLQSHYIDLIRKEIISEFIAEKQLKEDKINDATDS